MVVSAPMDARAVEAEARAAIAAAATSDELDAARVRFLGRNAELPQALRSELAAT